MTGFKTHVGVGVYDRQTHKKEAITRPNQATLVQLRSCYSSNPQPALCPEIIPHVARGQPCIIQPYAMCKHGWQRQTLNPVGDVRGVTSLNRRHAMHQMVALSLSLLSHTKYSTAPQGHTASQISRYMGGGEAKSPRPFQHCTGINHLQVMLSGQGVA